MSDLPKRIQRRRTKGWRMPEGAVSVARPGKWGNPWRVESRDGDLCCVDSRNGLVVKACGQQEALELCVAHYRAWMTPHTDTVRAELRGKDLACWCPLDQPCHADVLLEIANA